MRPEHVLLVLGLSALGSGCGVIKYGTMNTVEAPLGQLNELCDCARYRHLADRAWHDFQSAAPGHEYSVHFMRGFKEGFADYLEWGGTGAPPVAPPWCYQKSGYETPQGVQAIEDWFAGFHQGASAAQASGYRQVIVLPVAVAARPAPSLGLAQPVEAANDSVLPPPRPAVPEENPGAKP